MAEDVVTQSIQDGDDVVLDLIADMTAASLDRTSLDPTTVMMVRLASLVAVDAPPLSYYTNLTVAGGLGITEKDVEGVLAAVAPLVGTARVVAAAGNIARAVGISIIVSESGDMAIDS